MDFIQHGEPRDLMASLQCGSVQCLQHAVDSDSSGVSISVKNKADCSSLHCFSSVDVLLSVGVPDGRGILQHRPDKGFVGPFFDAGVTQLVIFRFCLRNPRILLALLQILFIYMVVPVELSVDVDPEVQ